MKNDWIEVKLNEACGVHDNLRKPINTTERNKRIKDKPISKLYPYYGATGQVGYIDDYITNGEFILLGEDGAPFLDYTKNVAYLIQGKTWVNNHAHVLLSHFNNKFLLHYLNSFNYKNYVSGTTRLKLTQGSLKQMPVKIAPLPEQRAIVGKIEKLFSDIDNGVANLKAAKDKLEIYRQAVLKKAFEGEFTKEWREKQTDLPTAEDLLKQINDGRIKHYENLLKEWENFVSNWEANGKKGKKPSKPTKLLVPDFPNREHEDRKWLIPKAWLWTQVGTICFVTKLAGFEYTDYVKYDENGDLYVIKAENAGEGGFKNTSFSKVKSDTVKTLKRSFVYGGELLIVFVGAGTGNVATVPYDKKYFLGPNVGMARPYIDINPKYLELLFHFHSGKHLMMATVKAVAQPSLSMGTIRQTPVALPSLGEQNQIVTEIETRLSVCDNILSTIDEALEKSEALRQSILKKAFEGRLLSQAELEACRKESDWEPADKLLERIKQEKDNSLRLRSEKIENRVVEQSPKARKGKYGK